MKFKTIFAVLSIAALAACTSPARHFTINGTVRDSLATRPGSRVLLLSEGAILDSAKVKDTGFTFTGKADTTAVYTIMLDYPGRNRRDDRFSASFIPEAGVISIDLDLPATVTGSRLSDALNKLQEDIMTTYYERESEIGELSMSGRNAEADSLYQLQMQKIMDICRKAYADNSGNAVGMEALMMLSQETDYDEFSALVAQGSDFIRNNEDIKSRLEVKKAEKESGAGAMFLDIEGVNAKGEAVRLSDLAGKGKYVLADFCASWCGPCMRALPTVRELRDKYADKGLTVVGINVWERGEGAGQAAAEAKEMDWDIIFTSGSEATGQYGIQAIPSFILIGPDGIIADRLLGDDGLVEMVSRHLD